MRYTLLLLILMSSIRCLAVGPTIGGFSPANNAIEVAGGSKISFTLSDPFTVEGGTISIFNASGLILLQTVQVLSGSVVGQTVTYTLPDRLPPSTTIRIAVDGGAFEDLGGNPSRAVFNGEWQFTTADGPSVTGFKPVRGAMNVLKTSNLEIDFDRNVVAVAGKKIKVTDGGNTVFTLDVTAGTIVDNVFKIDPPSPMPEGKLLIVTVDEGAFWDNATDQNYFLGVKGVDWLFNTTPEDTDPPHISVNNLGDARVMVTNGHGVDLQIIVSDNVDPWKVNVHYRKLAQTDGQFKSEGAASQGPYTDPNTEIFTFNLNESMADGMGLEFYIEAFDINNNVSYLPEKTGNTFNTFNTQLQIYNVDQSAMPIPAGGTKADWRIISVPWVLDNYQIDPILTAAFSSSTGPYSWKLLMYAGDSQFETWAEFPQFGNFQRGSGYFINSVNGGIIHFAHPTTPPNRQSALFEMDLKQGWNMIGNPYTVDINWDNIRNYNNNADIGHLVTYTAGTYSTINNTLISGQGGFVLMNSPARVKFSFPGQSSSGRIEAEESPYGPLDADDWMVDLKLSCGEISSELGGFGMNKKAAISYDTYDGFNVPRFFDFAEVNFPHPEHFMHYFSRDIISPATDAKWEFKVDTNIEGLATITWDNSSFGANDVDLFLYDEDQQVPVNMREQTSFNFDPKRSKRFQVFYGRNAYSKIEASVVRLGDAFPNPSAGRVTIPFSLPEVNGMSDVKLEMFDMVGHRISTIVSGKLAPGFYSSEWTDVDHPSGIYIYKLTVGSEVQTGKLLLKR